jgi:hypothetical protein
MSKTAMSVLPDPVSARTMLASPTQPPHDQLCQQESLIQLSDHSHIFADGLSGYLNLVAARNQRRRRHSERPGL